MSLEALLSSRLTNLRRTSDGWQAACPACRAMGADSAGNHLHVWFNGAFNCAKVGSDGDHNRAVRAFIYQNADGVILASLEVAVVDPDPKLTADPVYPEDMLSRLVPDHSYWMGRGISEATLRRYEGGVVPVLPRNKLSGRYVFPIRDHATRRIMGWTGRLVSEASFGPSWKHLVKSSRCVYPLVAHEAAIRKARKVVLVESVGDMLACAEAGIDYTLVLLGLHLNSRMLGFMVAANLDEVIISPNADAPRTAPDGTISHPGQDAAVKLRARLVPYLGEAKVRIRLPSQPKDWNDALVKQTGELAVFRAELEGAAPSTEPFTL